MNIEFRDTDKVLYLNPTDGLCNRMRAIDSAISFCKKNSIRLKVLWTKDKNILNSRFDQLFKQIDNIDIFELNGNYIPTNLFFPKISPSNNTSGKTIRNMAWKMTKAITQIENSIFYDDLLMLIAKITRDQNGKFNEEIYFRKVEEKIYNLLNGNTSYIASCWRLQHNESWYQDFQPIAELEHKINRLTTNFVNVLGIHIRRTDHNESIKQSPLKSFINLMEARINDNNSLKFYLSTDCQKTEKELGKLFGEYIITNNKNSYSRNSIEGIQDAVVDLYCLSRTKKIFGSHGSSFSQVASDISRIDVEIVT